MKCRWNNWPRFLLLGLLLAFAASFQARLGWEHLQFLLKGREMLQPPFLLEPFQTTVVLVRKPAAEAGLRLGDQILMVNGLPCLGRSVLRQALARSRPGDVLEVIVRHAGSDREDKLRIPLEPQLLNQPKIGDWLLVGVLNIATPTLCLLLGFLVAARRPRDRVSWILLGLMLSFGQMTAGGVPVQRLFEWEPWHRIPGIAFNQFFTGSLGFWLLMFGACFPEALPYERRYPWAKWLLGGPILLVATSRAIVTIGRSEDWVTLVGLHQFLKSLGIIPLILATAAVSSFFVNLGWKFRRSSTPDTTRRLRLLLWGAAVSLTPSFLLLLFVLGTGMRFVALSQWLWLPALLLLSLFPVTLAYVIVVQRALDVRVVIRQGVQYVLAKSGVRTVQVVLSAVVIYYTVLLANEPGEYRAERISTIAAGVTFVILMNRIAQRLRSFTDRRFFRDAYDAERILSDLSENVRTMVETKPLLETVAQRISESLHVPRIVLLLRKDGHYEPAHALGYGTPPRMSFPDDAPTVKQLSKAQEPLRVYLDDPDSWVNGEAGMELERIRLRALDARLLLPLAVKQDLLGFVSLGPKQSEEPYSSTDLRLLQSVAVQTGLALENSKLAAMVAVEVAQRERLNREIEIAREVQERLFPQKFPEVAGLEYAGKCRPAAGVGGDYYDFLEIPGGQFGIAVGDVSGKGVPGALLMASLQASLRGLTMVGTHDLGGLISNLNRLTYDTTPSNRYATFFYAQYDPGACRLSYVNAGHNAPMLLRASTGEIVRLEQGGLPLGVVHTSPYQQETVPLNAGDLLVAFTDGIVEAMNPTEEYWGEEKLEDALRKYAALPTGEFIDRVISEVDAFTSGAPQHDDMTMVVIKINSGAPACGKDSLGAARQ